TCPILSPLTNTVITSWDNGNSQYVDGAMPQCDRTKVTKTTTPNDRGVVSWKPPIGLKNITDGTSKTLLSGEAGRGTSEVDQAFNGDYYPALPIGETEPFCQRCTLPAPPLGTAPTGADALSYGDKGFGGAHNGVVQFVMCDGSVQTISKDINGPVL